MNPRGVVAFSSLVVFVILLISWKWNDVAATSAHRSSLAFLSGDREKPCLRQRCIADRIKLHASLSFQGAGEPRPELSPEEIPPLLMNALRYNDFPDIDSGLQSMWAFSSDTTRHIFANHQSDFLHSAHETADHFPTSFYGAAMYGKSWHMDTPLNRVGGGSGWIATQVMTTVCSDGRLRKWQWELRKHRRPPRLGCWYVEQIASSDRKGNFEPE